MADNNSNENIVDLSQRRAHGINLGAVIFLIILIYLVVAILNYFTQKHIESYQVKTGALSTNNIYKGVALRDETIVKSDKSGYVNYFAREGERIGAGNLVYTLDESGKVSDYLNTGNDSSDLSQQDLTELKTDILSFINDFDEKEFSSVYDFKYNVQGTILKLSNANILSDINKINNSGVSSLVTFNNSPQTGYVIYSVDGYEDLTLHDMTGDLLDWRTYENESKRKQLISNLLVGTDDPVYKLSTNEDWSIVIQTDQEKAAELLDEKYVKVRFLKNQDTSWGKVSVFTNDENETFVSFTFTNSMMTFCKDRFIDIELVLNENSGLKVPNSSIVNKYFYIVPKEYITKNKIDGSKGVLKKVYQEDGSQSTKFVETNIYDEEEENYYLDDMVLRNGDELVNEDSQTTFTLSGDKKGSLTGVYNINKGYADFKKIEKLYQNDEYSIIKSDTKYGLMEYDYIVLDASTVEDDELIYD